MLCSRQSLSSIIHTEYVSTHYLQNLFIVPEQFNPVEKPTWEIINAQQIQLSRY